MFKASLPLLFAALLAIACAACRGEAAAAPQAVPQIQKEPPAAPATGVSEPQDSMDNCDALPLSGKEACYARQPPEVIADCERMRLHHCAPYARMHALDKQLDESNRELLRVAGERYASYEANQPGYADDLAKAIAEADRAWRAYRDAQCSLDPLLQGMSRNEASDLAEACRADRTSARISELKEALSTVMEDTIDEQGKQ